MERRTDPDERTLSYQSLGQRFGRYELRSTLGAGGFATVYRAWDPDLGRKVALKALLPHLAADPNLRARFLGEARALARLRHQNIVTVYDVGEAGGQPFFTMELIEGQTLVDLVTSAEGLPPGQVVQIVQSLAAALDYLHRAGLVHRDVKAANVMIESSGRLVLMDLGIVRTLDQTQHTQAGVYMGTPAAMAPEQVRGQPVGPAADIYSLGVLTYQMLAGRPPFVGDTAAILYAHVYELPPPLRDIRPELPSSLSAVIESALAKDPAARPATAQEFADALARALAPTLAAPTQQVPALGTAPPKGEAGGWLARLNWKIAVAAALAALLVIGGGVVVSQLGSKKTPGTTASSGTLGPEERVDTPSTQVVVKTIAGTGSAAQLNSPTGVAVDRGGTVYVADASNHRIRKITPDGELVSLAGSDSPGFIDGRGNLARFNTPTGVAVDGTGNLYVADFRNHSIRKIAPDGEVTTLAGSGSPGFTNGRGAAARFNNPAGIAVDKAGNLYVADSSNHRIRKITPEGEVTTLAGSDSPGFSNGKGSQARFNTPIGVAVDNTGTVYVADFYNHSIRKITPEGEVTTLAGSGAEGFVNGKGSAARFRFPAGLAIDQAGNLYVADQSNHRIRKVTVDGEVSTFAGAGSPGSRDGPGEGAQFAEPRGVVVDEEGNVYVADERGHRIRKITPVGRN